jgi:Phage capsid family
MDKVKDGSIPKEEVVNLLAGMKDSLKNEEIKALKDELKTLDDAAKAQGFSLAEISAKLNSNEVGTKSIADVLKTDEEELKQIYKNRNGQKTYMINLNSKGEFVMRNFDETAKATGPVASITGINGGTSASISQSIDAASLLRLGGNAPIISQYRNNPWVFDLCNIVNAGFEQSLAMWYEEQARLGASATTTEGGTKPPTQYIYQLKSSTYKKEATLIGFTEEFNLDFARLQSDILGKGRTDVVNRINTAVLANIISAATAYNTGTTYKAAGGGVVAPAAYNDFIGLDALAAQVDSNTFGAFANAAVMSTYKKHRIGVTQDTQNRFINTPDFLQGLAMVGNPAMATDDVLVGDFKQYNIMLRGGLIVRVGYNGTDFAQNMFSVVLEQYYFDYISSIRAAAIVKGQTFATVKTAITT